jgi:hypothetical protein
MTRWRVLLACIAGVLAAAGPHGQTAGGRALSIAPDSANATRDWGAVVDRMVRGDELRVRLERSDTMLPGRSVEQLTQYYRTPARIWECASRDTPGSARASDSRGRTCR